METDYKPEDLPKFEDIRKDAQPLAHKFLAHYTVVFAEGELSERDKSYRTGCSPYRSVSLLH